jgi:hypothetical protein
MTFGEHLLSSMRAWRKVQPQGQSIPDHTWAAEVDRLKKEWDARERPAKPPRTPKKPPTDAEWIFGLSQRPEFAGIDISAEIDKCRRWCAVQRPPIIMTRRRVGNWLVKSKADAPLAQPKPAPQIEPEPPGWLEFMRVECPGWRPLMYDKPPTWANLLSLQRRDVIDTMTEHGTKILT